MEKYSSESDDSIEHMKLDLLKAKYLHQKLKKRTNLASNKKKVVNASDPIMTSSKPKFSITRNTRRNESLSSPSIIESKIKDYSEESDIGSEENDDIISMNNYVDYLLDKRRCNSNEDIKEEPNPQSSLTEHRLLLSSQDPSAEGFRTDNGDYSSSPAPNPSTDILAQWRLRRKLTEAKHSVRYEHQKHNLQINSLHMNALEPSDQSFPSTIRAETRQLVVDYGCDRVPVRDSAVSVSTETPHVALTKLPKSDSACQCCLDSSPRGFDTSKPSLTKEQITKSKRSSKMKRTVGLMTVRATSADASTLTDPVVETQQHRQQYSGHGSEYLEWDNQNSNPDYIDIAIEKTLHNQLFDRSCQSAMSTITSMNESNCGDTIPQLELGVCRTKEADGRLMNADKVIPWNEHYEIDSDEEFVDDDVLIDLRRRRAMNLDKLRTLALKIQNQTGKFPSVELS